MATEKGPISIEIRISRTTMRRALIIGGTFVLLAVGARFSSATPGSNLEGRIAALEKRTTLNGTYSVNATFCGATATSSAGDLGGYAGAKAACQAECGSTTAHMCIVDELVRSKATGITLVPGWYATGTVDLSGSSVIDCRAFTDPTGNSLGAAYSTTFGFSYDYCNAVHPTLCCD